MSSYLRKPNVVRMGFAVFVGLLTACVRAFSAPVPTQSPTLAQPRHAGSPLRLYLGEAADEDQVTRGAEAYRLVCQDCHGDRGQGLTSEWLQTWAPEDRNCWQSKCHGDNHPDDGFALPHYVPAIVGPNTLTAFQNALELYNYIALNMPWHDPGVVSAENTWDVVAFILQHHGVSVSPLLNAENAPRVPVNP